MPGKYDCTWRVTNNIALLDIERERESFFLFWNLWLLVGDKVWNMDRGTDMHLRKVCP